MRLESIRLSGFKSFVEPTTIPLKSNLVAIVGPNGCGKSNIVDAIRWVIGESSAKQLRAGAMADVIFSGTSKRPPLGQASIELNFDNSDGSLGGPYASYAKISVRRELNRDGHSDYYLNSTRCRRRDILDVFMGTGLSPRSYAIIEQGMISRLIEAKPDELRGYFEEVAGISKYKERRRETENRIRHTRDNLDRLTDLRDELGKQLNHLARQAEAAEKYKTWQKELRELKAEYQALLWQQLDTQFEAQQTRISREETGLQRKMAEQSAIDSHIEKSREEHHTATETYNEVQSRYYSMGAEISSLEQKIAHHQERLSELQTDLDELSQHRQDAEQHLQDDQDQLTTLQSEIDTLAPEAEAARTQASQTHQEREAAETAMQTWQENWDQFSTKSAKTRERIQVESAREQQFKQRLEHCGQQIQRLTEQQHAHQNTQMPAQIQALMQESQTKKQALANLETELENGQRIIAEHRQNAEQFTRAIETRQQQHQDHRAEFASLQAQQQATLGREEGVTTWLSQHQLDQTPRLLEQLEVQPKWRHAVETVLGQTLEALCVDDISQIARLAQGLSHGQVTALAKATQAPTASPQSLASQVTTTLALPAFFYQVEMANDLNDALQRRQQLNAEQSLITPEGIWLGRDWIRVAKQGSDTQSVLDCQQRIETLSQDIDRTQAQLSEQQRQLANTEQQRKEAEQQHDHHQQQYRTLSDEYAEIHAKLSAEQARLEQREQQNLQTARDLEEQKTTQDQLTEQLAQTEAALVEAKTQADAHDAECQEWLSQKQTVQQTLDEARNTQQSKTQTADELQIRLETSRNQLQMLKQNITRTNQQFEQMTHRRGALEKALADSKSPLPTLTEALEKKLEQRLSVEQALTEARTHMDQLDEQLRDFDKRRHALEAELGEERERLEALKIECQTLTVRRETHQEQITEMGYDTESIVNTLPENASVDAWQKRISDSERRIDRLGAINLAAIDEQKELSERKNYLDAQNEDLTDSLDTLEGAIKKIDHETRERFKQTFDHVNQLFGEIFPKIFGGGKAALTLTEDDVLSAGVLVTAQPPGKKNTTIHMLSGGEKALTATALVFALFQINPAPFCILDEVDAPLDDANVMRFCGLVKEMSKTVQFIFISHNKITIEMADQLCGVTMNEPGVSRLVSVDVNQAMEMAEA